MFKMLQKEKACLAIVLYFASAKELKRRRWAKKWYLKQGEFTRENLLRELNLSEPRDNQNCLRMNNDSVNELLEMIKPIITFNNYLRNSTFKNPLLSPIIIFSVEYT